jgi:O-antigen/teichoic acid export membrane protein
MNTVQRFVKNISYLYGGNIVIRALNLVLFVYIARYLHDTGLGQYSFIIAIAGLVAVVHDAGYSVVISREVAKDKTRASAYVSNVLFIKAGSFIIAFFLVFFSINILGYPQEIKNLVYLYTVATFFISFESPFRALYVAYEKMEYSSLVSILERVIAVPLSIAALILGFGLEGLIIALLITEGITLFISFLIVSKKITRLKFEIDLRFCKKIIIMTPPFILLAVFNTLYHTIDIIMLSKIAGDAAVGWYSASYRLISALLFIPSLFMGALFPVMARFYVSSRDSLILAYQTSFKFLLIFALPLAIGVTLLADRIVIRLYGDIFLNSVPALQILIWTAGIMFLNNVFLTVFLSTNKEKINTKIVIFGVTINIALNLILIPRFFHIGASIATLVAEVVLFVLSFYYISKYLHVLPLHKLVLKPILASLAMAAFVLYFREIITLFILIPLSVALYFVALFILKEFQEEELDLLRKVRTNN